MSWQERRFDCRSALHRGDATPNAVGVTFSALLFNLVFTMEVFLLTRNHVSIALAPAHAGSSTLHNDACLRRRVSPQSKHTDVSDSWRPLSYQRRYVSLRLSQFPENS